LVSAGSSKLTSYFKSSDPHNKELDLAAKKSTFAYHTVNYNLSFNSNTCNSKFFEPKFTLCKTKCEAIVLNILAPLTLGELHQNLKECNFITVSIDASNRKNIKLIRYFLPEFGIKVKLLEFKSIQGETAKILTYHIMLVLKKHNLDKKIVGFFGNNFGGVKRRENNNVFTRLKNELQRNQWNWL
jgi:hypothetical protein